jgi:DNA-binding NarL/FixJ family response regulator
MPPRRDGPRATFFDFAGERYVVLAYPLAEPPNLSAAERAITRAVLLGKSNDEIARERGRSVRTVANQVAAVFRKLGVGSRSELAAALAMSSP